jgi:predicted ArsR family transcriptional regulator
VELLHVRPQRAGELVAAFDISAPAVSRHLKVLRAAVDVPCDPGTAFEIFTGDIGT